MKQVVAGAVIMVAAAGLVAGGMGIASAVGGLRTASRPAAAAAKFGHTVRPATTPLVPSPEEQLFTPMPACRILDTRVHNKPAGTTAATIQVTGTAGFPAQGGLAGGCAIPATATAVATTVMVTQEATRGYLEVYPAGATHRTASVNFAKGLPLSNSLTLPITTGAGPNLTMRSNRRTQVVIDVTGYYVPQIQAYVRLSVTPAYIYSGTSRVLSLTNPATGEAVLTFDRTVEQCAAQATPASDNEYASGYTVGNEAIVTAWYLDPTTHAEVKANIDFNLTLTC
jgi:hypothetical protein